MFRQVRDVFHPVHPAPMAPMHEKQRLPITEHAPIDVKTFAFYDNMLGGFVEFR